MKKNIFLIFALAMSSLTFVSCDYEDDITEPDYVRLEFAAGGAPLGVEVDGSGTYDVNIYSAKVQGSDRTYNINVLGSSTISPDAYTVPETVTIPAGSNEASFTVNASDIGLGVSGKRLDLTVEEEAGFSVGDALSINVGRVCPGEEFVVQFAFDGYASETSWSISDSEDNVVVSGSGYEDGTETLTRSYCLSPGDYKFSVEDSFGDGLTYPNLGSITISYAGNVLTTIDGDYGEGTTVDVSF